MSADETVRGLRYTQKKYENKVILTGETDVSAMCRDSADLIESLQAQLADYPHMDQLVNGKMAENQRLRQINEKLQSQLAASQREKRAAVEDWKIYEDSGQCDVCKYGECGGCTYPEGGRCRFEWRGPQEAGKGEAK